MIAVVYSGSKTAFWKIAKDGKTIADCKMPGINPLFNDKKTILHNLNRKATLINYAERIKKIYVFAAGASTESKKQELAGILSSFFKFSKIVINDDLTGAAIASCYNKTGIVGILGSGAHCAYFDGKKPENNNFGLGFILGDEGSSNYLGKKLLKHYLEEKLPADLKEAFDKKYNLDRPQILERIYRKPLVQQYLSSFLEFFIDNRNHEFIQNLIDNAFDIYINTYLLPTVKLHPGNEIYFSGIVAGNFQDRLRSVAGRYNMEITTITKEPIYNLLNYYSN